MLEIRIPSTNQKDNLHVCIWEPEGDIKAIVQISHGMIEYIDRYDEFARFLNSKGILVIGNDHLGHGKTASTDDDLGYFGAGKSETVVDDLHEVTKYAKEKYGEEIPFILFGHSMGSFMARRYLMTYGDELTLGIICGTGGQPGIVLAIGKFVCGVIKLFRGEKYRTKLIEALSFGAYNKRIKNPRTNNDWLSRNEANVDKYLGDKYCTFKFTVNGYSTLFGVIDFIQKKKNMDKLRRDLPMLIIAGAEDPVGNYGKEVSAIFERYKKLGIKDISLKLYQDDRHEILNEIDREDIFADIYSWIEKELWLCV